MIITENVKLIISTKTIKYYRNKGYNCNVGDEISINVKDLTKGSQVQIKVKCDICGNEKVISNQAYNKNISKYPIYCCNTSCAKIKEYKTNSMKYGDGFQNIRTNKRETTNKKRYGDENASKIFRNEKEQKVFIDELILKYGNKYDYSKINYINNYTKVNIICPIHGDVLVKPKNFIGCTKCNRYDEIILSLNKWLDKSKEIYLDKFDYSNVIFNTVNKKVEIICPEHGSFLVTPSNHLKRNCPKCGDKVRRLKLIKRLEENKLNGHQLVPNFNKDACKLFDEISLKEGIHIQHAMNGGEFYIKELGYWVDGYDKENNIVYEFDEKHHNNKLEKDLIRQIEIEQYLKCEFIRIKE
ncbi:hypothetical protein M0Q50_00955 [bacterium]|jgi:hypothetical protein|nr:hypothetical protein [bacterium]